MTGTTFHAVTKSCGTAMSLYV